jgi:hypothetical protein
MQNIVGVARTVSSFMLELIAVNCSLGCTASAGRLFVVITAGSCHALHSYSGPSELASIWPVTLVEMETKSGVPVTSLAAWGKGVVCSTVVELTIAAKFAECTGRRRLANSNYLNSVDMPRFAIAHIASYSGRKCAGFMVGSNLLKEHCFSSAFFVSALELIAANTVITGYYRPLEVCQFLKCY